MRGSGVLEVATRHDQRRQLRAQTWRERSESMLTPGVGAVALGSLALLPLGWYAKRKWGVGLLAPPTSRTVKIGRFDDPTHASQAAAASRRASVPRVTLQVSLAKLILERSSRDIAFSIRFFTDPPSRGRRSVDCPSLHARAFYDAYDAVVQNVGESVRESLLARMTIRYPTDVALHEYTNAFRAAERVVTYWRGFTEADPPPGVGHVHAKVTLHKAGSEFLHFSRVGPEICKFVTAVASASVSASGSGSDSGATQNLAAPLVGIMIDASAGILTEPYGRDGFVESWLSAERPNELTEAESGFLASAGLPQRGGISGFNADHNDAAVLLDLFSNVSGASGVSGDLTANARAV